MSDVLDGGFSALHNVKMQIFKTHVTLKLQSSMSSHAACDGMQCNVKGKWGKNTTFFVVMFIKQ